MTLRLFLVAALLGLLPLVGCSSDDPVAPEVSTGPPPGFVRIPAGSFVMGSPLEELGRGEFEEPHPVTISRAFDMKAHEVTNEEYRLAAQWALDAGLIRMTARAIDSGDTIRVLRDVANGENFFISFINGCELEYNAATNTIYLYDVGFGINPDHPVKYLTWWGAAAYCNWLSMMEGLPPAYDQTTWSLDYFNAEGYRLPTEAEWEYASRAGSQAAYAGSGISTIGCEPDSLQYQGWYCFNADGWTHPVGSLPPNAFGLYDMHGNVWEFCNDWYYRDFYFESPVKDPFGPSDADLAGSNGLWHKTARGGAWTSPSQYARAAQRGAHFLGMVSEQEGVRPVRTVID